MRGSEGEELRERDRGRGSEGEAGRERDREREGSEVQEFPEGQGSLTCQNCLRNM